MSIKREVGKILTVGATKAVKNMVQLPALNWHYQLIDKTNDLIANGLYKALSAPSNIKNEATEAMYEARKNKFDEDIGYNNTTPYTLNKMLEDAQVYSNVHLYQARVNSNNIAEQLANIERANRNLHKFKS